MRIQVTTADGQTQWINVEESDRFGSVLRQLETGDGASFSEETILVEQRLPSAQEPPSTSLRIFVRTLDKRELRLKAQPSSTIYHMKRSIEVQEFVPPELQRLIFNGAEMENSRSLSACGIVNDSTLYVVYCLRGAFTILLQPQSGKALSLEVMPTDTVEDVKKMVEKRHKIPLRLQRLLLRGRRLKDNAILSDYNIREETTVHLVLCRPSEMHVFVHLPSEVDIRVEVELGETVEEVKAKIEEKEGIAIGKQRLLYKGRPLENDCSLFSVNVRNRARLRLLPHRTEAFPIHVTTFTGRKIHLDVEPSDTTDELKAMMEDAAEIPPDQQRFFVSGKPLQDGMALSDMEVAEGCDVSLVRNRGQMTILVAMASGRTFKLNVDCLKSVLKVKEKIQEVVDFSPNSQRLRWRRTWLEDSRILSDYDIHDHSTLRLYQRLLGDFVILVKLHDDVALKFRVGMSNTVADLKAAIIDEVATCPELTITFGGRELEDGRTLREFKVEDKSVLCATVTRETLIPIYVISPIHASQKILYVDLDWEVTTLKSQISCEIGVGEASMSLIFSFKSLSDSDNLKNSGLYAGCRVHVTIRFRGGGMPYIKVRTQSDTFSLLFPNLSITVKEIKRNIEDEKCFPAEKQLLIFTGKLLEDDRSLSDYDIPVGADVDLLELKPLPATISGERGAVKVDLSSSVQEVATLIHRKFDVACEKLRLVVAPAHRR